MPSTERAILDDVTQALACGGLFAETRAAAGASAAGAGNGVPRATVMLQGRDVLAGDDSADALWVRLRLRVVIHDRADDVADAAARVADLCSAAGAALLSDPYRSGLCSDLPVGRATELGATDPVDIRQPEVEVGLTVRCHFETQEGSP
ncbi:MAG: hypothetical protein ACOC8F_04195 [Planctomycetota bacterium]